MEYDINLERSERGPWSQITTVHARDRKAVDLGEKRLLARSGPRSLKDRVAAAFGSKTPLAERLAAAKHDAARDYLRIAVIVAAPDSNQAEWFYRLLRGTGDDREGIAEEVKIRAIRSGLNDFRQLWVNATQFDELRRLIPDHRMKEHHESALILLENSGK